MLFLLMLLKNEFALHVRPNCTVRRCSPLPSAPLLMHDRPCRWHLVRYLCLSSLPYCLPPPRLPLPDALPPPTPPALPPLKQLHWLPNRQRCITFRSPIVSLYNICKKCEPPTTIHSPLPSQAAIAIATLARSPPDIPQTPLRLR